MNNIVTTQINLNSIWIDLIMTRNIITPPALPTDWANVDYRVHILCQEEFAEKILDKCSRVHLYTQDVFVPEYTLQGDTHTHTGPDVPEYTGRI